MNTDSGAAPNLRRTVLLFVLSVAALDAVAIAVFYGLHIRQWPETKQRIYLFGWMAATLIIVLCNLTVIRKLRRGRGRYQR